jgi:hypothetical protein
MCIKMASAPRHHEGTAVLLPLARVSTREAHNVWRLPEVNVTRVQSDILNRIQESQSYLEVEIRQLLHEVSRAAEQALNNARKVREDGASAVEAASARLGRLEQEAVTLRDVPSLRFSI